MLVWLWQFVNHTLARFFCASCTDDINNWQPRQVAKVTRSVEKHIHPLSLTISDGWAATKHVDWLRLRMRYEFCMHFLRFNRVTHAKFRNRCWVNTRSFHRNHAGALFSKSKRWARARNGGRLPVIFYQLDMSLADFSMRHCFAARVLCSILLLARRCAQVFSLLLVCCVDHPDFEDLRLRPWGGRITLVYIYKLMH